MNPEELIKEVESRTAALVKLCQDLVQVPSIDRESSPPGDTTAMCELVGSVLSNANIPWKKVVAREGLPNLIAHVDGDGRPGPHVILNGHLDTFPIGDAASWTYPPFSGALVDGRIYGRGAIDMKGGDAALITAFLILAERRNSWSGRLTLTLVSDEETGAKYGTEHLVESLPEVHGDYVLSAEPSGVGLVRFGEKGATRITVSARGRTGHSPVPSSGSNAIELLTAFLKDLLSLRDLRVEVPTWFADTLEAMRPTFEAIYGTGTADLMRQVTVNIGTIVGGQKDNIIPGYAEAWIDIRLPFGLTHAQMLTELDGLLMDHPQVSYEVRHWRDPNVSDPNNPLFAIFRESVARVAGREPTLSCSFGGTDCRFWRYRGIPAAVYGPDAHNLGSENEYIEVGDLVTVAKSHAVVLSKLLRPRGVN